jgi:membrane-bound lytic murein transglycosylase B
MNKSLALCIALTLGGAAYADDAADLQQAFVAEMATKYQFDPQALNALLDQAQVQQPILDAIARPAEKRLNWGQYRKIFLTRQRIRGGLAFWKANEKALREAEQKYGVPPQIVVAIIGVETLYGKHTGKYPVLDALVTLGFHYPKRGKFFRSELSQFLRLAREEGVDPREPLGSYAGAMGRPQFIPSSFRAYAVDFDGDGKRNIWDDNADVIGSVANYFAAHGWQHGEPVAQRVQGVDESHLPLIEAGLKPHVRIGELQQHGIKLPKPLPEDTKTALLALETDKGTQYWLGLPNFYAITRYNHSPLYAMAVFQLSEAIRALHDRPHKHPA